MSTTGVIILIVVIVVVVALAAVVARSTMRRRALKDQFGAEYDRTVTDSGSRSAAENELRDRQRKHGELTLTDLSTEDRARFTERWTTVQAQFVDDPASAVTAADSLVTEIATQRGYPTGEYDAQLVQLSVEHARVLDDYRTAHDISVRNDQGSASTEELRQALVHYRTLIADLMDEPALDEPPRTDGPAVTESPLSNDTTAATDGTTASAPDAVVPPTNADTETDSVPAAELDSEPTLVPDAPIPQKERRR
jgi:hypothetical protein